MRKRPDPRQLDIFNWSPPTATVLRHPAVFRKVWMPKIADIAADIIAMPERAATILKWGPIRLGEQLAGMGATEHEIAREVLLYQQHLLAELARRRHSERQGPGAA